jgi:hypothetical protein
MLLSPLVACDEVGIRSGTSCWLYNSFCACMNATIPVVLMFMSFVLVTMMVF